jgi:predicted ATPase
MIRSVKINGYRALANFEMTGLGRVNLLVGKNNTGKSSVLEAIFLLASGGDPNALWRIMAGRGEQVMTAEQQARLPEFDISHLFHAHETKIGNNITITTTNESPARSINFQVVEAKRDENAALFAQMPRDATEGIIGPQLAVSITGNPTPVIPLVPLSSRGGFRIEMMQVLNNMAVNAGTKADVITPQYISTNSLPMNDLMTAWNAISLTPHQKRVIEALTFLEPKIEDMAIAPATVFMAAFPQRGGFKIKLKNEPLPIPIGSLGDGTWRMLALALTISKAKDSILLIDEIDTGFHHTVMIAMWKFIAEAAKAFNVQIFATSHSHDSVFSLAKICREVDNSKSDITIQRLEAGKTKSVPFNETEIKIASETKIEMM